MSEHNLYHFSQTAANLKRSVMRDLLKLAVSPDIISFAGGLPAADHLPVDQFRACLDTVLRRDGPHALQYGPPYTPLREWLADYMGSRGVDCTPDNILITNGAQQGLEILSRLFVDPGEVVVIEAITFTGIRQVVSSRGAEAIKVPTDLQTGVDIVALERALQRSPKPRLTILITDFHNPLGVSLSLEKRQQVAALAAQYDVPVVEDDPYAALRYAGQPLPPIKAYDIAEMVVYSSSFSKMLAPAVRLGWLVAPEALIPKLTVLRESLDIESSALMQRAVYEFLAQGHLEPHLTALNRANRARRDALLAALETHLDGLALWTVPDGGLFVWVTLPEDVDTWAMFKDAVAHKVAYIPGAAFGGGKNMLRLNYSNLQPDKIRAGIKKLAEIILARVALVHR